MDWTWYLFSFHGRINRAKYWLAGLVMFGWMLLTAWIIYLCLRLVADGSLPVPASFHFGTEAILAILDPATYHVPTRADVVPIIGNVIGTPVLLWIFLATSIKRLHDRDRSGWWLVPFVAVPALYDHFADRLPDSYLLIPVGLIAAILCIWGFIELGCLKGNSWPNRFGPNPLGKQPSGSRSAHARLRATTAWDQQSEIEILPHIGSPPPAMHVKRGA